MTEMDREGEGLYGCIVRPFEEKEERGKEKA